MKVENQAGLQDITSVVAIAGCYCTMEPYVDSKYDLYIQKIGNNYRTFVYVSVIILARFHANVTTLRLAYGMNRPSVVCLSSVCDVVAPTQPET